MTVPDRRQWWRSIFQRTGQDPEWIGFWLLRHRRHEGQKLARLARRLGLDLEGLAMLCLCRTPRDAAFADDLDVICRKTGADSEGLARLLRQEQTLHRWREKPPARQGWLAAASDAEPERPPSPTPESETLPNDQ